MHCVDVDDDDGDSPEGNFVSPSFIIILSTITMLV